MGAAYWRNDMTSESKFCSQSFFASWIRFFWNLIKKRGLLGVHWPASCCVKNITGYVDLDKCQTDPAAPASVRFSKVTKKREAEILRETKVKFIF